MVGADRGGRAVSGGITKIVPAGKNVCPVGCDRCQSVELKL